MKAKFFQKDRPEDAFDMHIDRNGQWYHQGMPIARDRLSKLFSTVLHYDREKDEYWLVTPHEQGRVMVEDVPYIVTDYVLEDNKFTLTTSLGHKIQADPDHQIECDAENGLPYIHVANGAKARLNRSVREALINEALEQGGYDEASGNLYLTVNTIRHHLARDKGE